MPITKSESTKIVKLDFTDIPNKDEARSIAKEIILDGIQESLDVGESPVKGGKFKRFKADGDLCQLFETGEMRSKIKAEDHSQGIKVGIFRSAKKIDREKASGHNRGDSASGVQRQFIPFPTGEFSEEIMGEVNTALDELRVTEDESETLDLLIEESGGITADVDINLSNIFSDSALESLISRVLDGEN